jgi:glutaminyl-peptide cyclotransferase
VFFDFVKFRTTRGQILAVSLLLAVDFSCTEKKSSGNIDTKVIAPSFSADSAFQFVKTQVDFGPRVPNQLPHDKAAEYFVSELKERGAIVLVQSFEAPSFDGHQLKLKNIIASFSPEEPKRILLAAHWDTRPFADKDNDHRDAPFDGANDGASGVAILLEIARLLAETPPPNVGVDIILFDGEDWGEKEYEGRQISPPKNWEEWWCLGSQYWARNKHRSNYSAYYGILLDMVGAKGSRFYREGVSLQYAPAIVNKVWNAAEKIGYSDYFVKQNVGSITDDHVFVNKLANIPMIDIVPYHPTKGFFGDYHHTTKDNLDLIDKQTLQAVGKTLLQVIYSEGRN